MEPRWLNAYAEMMHRLEAEEALLATQIAFLPHYNKQADRRKVIQQWEREARRGSRSGGVQYDQHGREIVDNIDDFNSWLRAMGVA